MSLVTLLLGALAVSGLLLAIRAWQVSKRGTPDGRLGTPSVVELVIGFATNFFDTLGIGSFAPTTAVFRLLRIVPDELIPGTLIVGHMLPVVTQAILFIGVIAVDPWQMTALIAICVAGGWVGAGAVAALSRRSVQLGMGVALAIAAAFMLLGLLEWIPGGGDARALGPWPLALALAVNFVLGALLTIGVGNYAPSLVMFSLLGMDPRAAFPIMMGSGAFVATIAGHQFLSAGRFQPRTAAGLTLGGIPGVFVAVWLVQSLPLDALRWLVVVVVMYVSATLLRSGLERPPPT